MQAAVSGAQAPTGKSRPVTSYSVSAIVQRGTSETMVDPEFDEDTYTRSPQGDTLYQAAYAGGRLPAYAGAAA